MNLKDISTHRTELMGLGTILIIICHSPANGVQMPRLVETIVRHGSVGVDIFLLLSGLGLFFSLKQKQNIRDWYVKRYTRILVPFFVFSIPYYIFRFYVDDDSIWHLLSNVLTKGYWTRHEGAWFVALLIPLYFSTPYLAKIIDKSRSRFFTTIIICAIFVLAYIVPVSNSILKNIQFCAAHVPSFIIGYWLGKLIFERRDVDVQIVIACIGFVCLFTLLCFTNLPKNWLLLVPSVILLTKLLNIRPSSFFNKILAFMGVISLESYLMNIYLPVTLRKMGFKELLNSFDNGYFFYLIVVVIGITGAYYGHKLCSFILDRCQCNLSNIK